MSLELDHLVLAARTLAEGVTWCERTLGVTPGPGGKHALMGTHNRVFAIGSPAWPRAYFEVIAVDPEAAAPGRTRWFDLDSPALQAALARGPRLVQWVARTADLAASVARLAACGVDAGRVLEASRQTPQGELRWRIALRDDGARLFGGALPLLIEWATAHPADALPASGVSVDGLALGGAAPAALAQALAPLGLSALQARGPALQARLNTPRGAVTLSTAD